MSDPIPNHDANVAHAPRAAALLGIDPSGEDCASRVATVVSADPRLERLVLHVAGAATLDEFVLHHGAAGARALAFGLALCLEECAAQAPRWRRPLAVACAARAIANCIQVGGGSDAFVLGLLAGFGSAGLAAWRLPAPITRALALRESADRGAETDQDDAASLARILDHAGLVADTQCADVVRGGIDWARASSGLDVLREVLEIDQEAFAALFLRVGREWADSHALLGLSVPGVSTLDDVRRRVGEVLADDAVVRALEPGSSSQLKGLRILAVDDDPVSLKILERALRKAGHDVIPAVNGDDALRIALETHPHAVIADWMMPGMDGLELCQALRRSELGRSVFYLLLTGRGEEDRIVEAFDAGVDDYVTKPFNPRILLARLKGGQRVIELQERVEANRRVVMKQVAEMGLLTRKLRNAAHTDALTELPNRRYAMGRLESEWELSGPRSGRPLSVVLIDIDHFKRVNDTYGHDVGDLVLKEVAVVLRANTRQGEEAARLGGEEFFVVCPNTDEVRARIAAERLRTAIERHVIQGLGFQGGVTISVGVAQRDPSMPNQDALIKAADGAVYAAKSAGRNRVVVASEMGSIAQSA